MARAIGAGDKPSAGAVFNQSFMLSLVFMLATFGLGFGFGGQFVATLAASPAILEAGHAYLMWYLPGLALQFPIATLGAALRAFGVTRPVMIVQMVSVACNIILAPILIAGWGTGHALGVAGAGLASSLSVIISLGLIGIYYWRENTHIALSLKGMMPDFKRIQSIIAIGLPTGGEFMMIFVLNSVIFTMLKPFGEAEQAGFAIGGRIMQMLFLPAMAISFSLPAVLGQNFGCAFARPRARSFSRRAYDRVRFDGGLGHCRANQSAFFRRLVFQRP